MSIERRYKQIRNEQKTKGLWMQRNKRKIPNIDDQKMPLRNLIKSEPAKTIKAHDGSQDLRCT